jgi:murein DD-endopeptidase MepM/ murein hydrolase activator NlpD
MAHFPVKEASMHTYPHAPFQNGGQIAKPFSKEHSALDIGPRDDDDGQVFAVEGGTVTDVEASMKPRGDHANVVIVQGADTLLTLYVHVAPSVLPNAWVDSGDKLGDVDLSGESSDRHVHLQRLDAGAGTVQDAIDRQDAGLFLQIKSLKPWS